MKTLSVSDARNSFTTLVDEIVATHESVLVVRYGKPTVMIVPAEASETASNPYPLRGLPLAMAPDFNDSTESLWDALTVADKGAPYGNESLNAEKANDIVLDTQAWLWWLDAPENIPAATRQRIADAEKTKSIRVSVISVWEIATKVALGKLSIGLPIEEWFAKARSYPGIVIEPVSAEDSINSTLLPGDFHRDPADRIIVALARRHHATLISFDRKILDYRHVKSAWQ